MFTAEMLKSMAKVEQTRSARMNVALSRFGAEEKETLLQEFHPDYRQSGFQVLQLGPNQGDKVPTELAELLQAHSRITSQEVDLNIVDYDVDVLIIGGGGAGAAAALEAHQAGAKVLVVTKLRIGDANTMMAEGGIQAADKENDSPTIHYLDALGGGHYSNKPELLKRLVNDGPLAIKWLNDLGVMFDKDEQGVMMTTHGGGTSRKRMHAAADYTGAEIMRVLRDEVINQGITTVDFAPAIELIMD
ncbi:MAG: FAD-dependent oxidoreductase, partial [Acidaminococcaceae bacterium]